MIDPQRQANKYIKNLGKDLPPAVLGSRSVCRGEAHAESHAALSMHRARLLCLRFDERKAACPSTPPRARFCGSPYPPPSRGPAQHKPPSSVLRLMYVTWLSNMLLLSMAAQTCSLL